MQLTRAADYAVRVMIHLASQPEGAVVSKAVLAKEAEAPESFLSKILQSLAHAGFIQARRGVVGGFCLLARGARASLLDVVETIDGPIALNVCVASDSDCHRSAACPAHVVWARAQSAMLSVLREAKITEMVSSSGSETAQTFQNEMSHPKRVTQQGEMQADPAHPKLLPTARKAWQRNKITN